MAKVGNIMARHNGANVAVADIYDQKLFAQSTPVEYVDSDTYFLFRAGADGQFADECNNFTYEIKNSQYSTVDTHDDNFFIHMSNTSRFYVTLDDTDMFDSMKENGYSVDGIFYYPQNTFNRYQRLIQLRYIYVNIKSYGNSASLQVGNSSVVNSTETITLDNDIFAAPFHFACIHQEATMSMYFNGVHKKNFSYQIKNAMGSAEKIWSVGNQSLVTSTSDISCALFRLSEGLRWTDNFTPSFANVLYGFSSRNIPIRHNNTTYYAPLVTTANKPCIAVRHNNQTFYTVRS